MYYIYFPSETVCCKWIYINIHPAEPSGIKTTTTKPKKNHHEYEAERAPSGNLLTIGIQTEGINTLAFLWPNPGGMVNRTACKISWNNHYKIIFKKTKKQLHWLFTLERSSTICNASVNLYSVLCINVDRLWCESWAPRTSSYGNARACQQTRQQTNTRSRIWWL